MTHLSHWPLQKAVYATLSEDSTLMGVLSGVHDLPPQDAVFPYALVGDAQSRDASTATTKGMEFNFILRFMTREAGRKQATWLMERAHALLHGQNISVEGQALIYLRCESGDITLDNDGITHTGSLRFRALLEEN